MLFKMSVCIHMCVSSVQTHVFQMCCVHVCFKCVFQVCVCLISCVSCILSPFTVLTYWVRYVGLVSDCAVLLLLLAERIAHYLFFSPLKKKKPYIYVYVYLCRLSSTFFCPSKAQHCFHIWHLGFYFIVSQIYVMCLFSSFSRPLQYLVLYRKICTLEFYPGVVVWAWRI